MKTKIFIDGQEGTTGLAIHEHLKARTEFEILEVDSVKRKETSYRADMFDHADLAILCLPDEAAVKTPELAGKTKLLDASTAHRVNPAWSYGLPELSATQRDEIADARHVSNPGCYPTGVILLLRPLIEAGIVDPSTLIKIHAVSGYSGGGKRLISKYEPHRHDLLDTRPYSLTLNHKHLPEMKKYSLLEQSPLFVPSVGPFRQGMLVQIPLAIEELQHGKSGYDVVKVYQERYADEPFVVTHEYNSDSCLEANFLSATARNGTNFVDLFVFGNGIQLLLIARLDNLGKGASLAAVQNINLMLGLKETAGIA